MSPVDIPTYTLDAAGEIAKAVLVDSQNGVRSIMVRHNLQDRFKVALGRINDLKLLSASDDEQRYSRAAFYAGGEAALTAFYESYTSDGIRTSSAIRNDTMRSLVGGIPNYLTDNIFTDSPEAAEKLEASTRSGHDSHPELKKVTGLIVDYYTDKSFEASIDNYGAIGRLASCGVGIIIQRLDIAWEQTHLQIDVLCAKLAENANPGSFDWSGKSRK